jgi:TPP-dependent 2-oxoacid decarboxylase
MKAKLAEQTKTGADVVVEMLEARGTKYIFGVPGAKIDKVFDTLRNSSIQTVVCRHEQNAAFIAGGIGRMTGNAGVAIATSGPGVSNLVTGLATANSEGDPMVALKWRCPSRGAPQIGASDDGLGKHLQANHQVRGGGRFTGFHRGSAHGRISRR